jgi:hypothetical protein
LELAIHCFGSIGRCLKDCHQDAIDLGFHGLATVAGDGLAQNQLDQLGQAPGQEWSVASWGSLLDPECRDLQHASSIPEPNIALQAQGTVQQVLSRFKLTGAKLLLLEAGYLHATGVRERGDRLLASLREAGRIEAGLEALEPLELARKEIGERQLEQFARFVHDIHRLAPGLQLAVVAGDSPASLLTPAFLQMLRVDADLSWLGYWHDCGRCEARAAFELDLPGDWLDLSGPFLRGCTLHDWAEGRDFLLPGEGQVDFPLLADYLPRAAQQVLSVAPLYPMDALPQARETLVSAGIR